MSLLRWVVPVALVAALGLSSASCSTGSSPGDVQSDVKQGKIESAAKKMEEARDSDPDDFDTRMKLGELYYELARKAIDEDKQSEYVEYLRKAQTEIIAAARIEPTSPEPHTWLGIITAYEGDLNGSETAFRNALRLAQRDQYRQYSGGTYYSNLAHISVYKGDLQSARRYLDKAAKSGAPQDELDRISVLLAWKENDMVEARDVFNGGVIMSKAFATTWDGAPLPKKMTTFDDFAAVCCKNPTCGPHMENACKRERQTVARRELTIDTIAEQMKIERERRQKLKEIYGKKGGVEITIEDPNAPAPTPQATPAPAPAPTPAPAKK
jgi:tetratricopeptide (TPR) repeat protein